MGFIADRDFLKNPNTGSPCSLPVPFANRRGWRPLTSLYKKSSPAVFGTIPLDTPNPPWICGSCITRMGATPAEMFATCLVFDSLPCPGSWQLPLTASLRSSGCRVRSLGGFSIFASL